MDYVPTRYDASSSNDLRPVDDSIMPDVEVASQLEIRGEVKRTTRTAKLSGYVLIAIAIP